MSSVNINCVCLCGKKKLKLNDTNWRRHLSSCDIAKLKSKKQVNDISSFLNKKRTIDELPM